MGVNVFCLPTTNLHPFLFLWWVHTLPYQEINQRLLSLSLIDSLLWYFPWNSGSILGECSVRTDFSLLFHKLEIPATGCEELLCIQVVPFKQILRFHNIQSSDEHFYQTVVQRWIKQHDCIPKFQSFVFARIEKRTVTQSTDKTPDGAPQYSPCKHSSRLLHHVHAPPSHCRIFQGAFNVHLVHHNFLLLLITFFIANWALRVGLSASTTFRNDTRSRAVARKSHVKLAPKHPFPIPLRYIDATWTTHTTLDVLQESHIDDYGIIDVNRNLSESWIGFTQLTILN